ncbi:MAG TPA: cutinase family protein [Solirubrobacteraceae bacterium]|nr:cutinase family protein [Solirubrobacteraceae bacterium]
MAPGHYTVAVYDPAGTRPTTWFGNVTSNARAGHFAVTGGATTSGVDVAVGQFTGIAGRVRDAVTAGRVDGACIYATQTTGGAATYATCLSSASDRFAITGMSPGTYEVAFFDPAGLHPTLRRTVTVAAGRTTLGVDADMGQIASVVGSIVDATTSGPVANGCVMLYAPGADYVPGSYRCADADGRFVIDGVAPGKYLVAFYDPAARFETVWFDGRPEKGSAAVITVAADTITTLGAQRVSTFGALSGRVLDGDGAPMSGVCVYANDLTGRYTGVGGCSTTDGRYTLRGLKGGQYRIAFYPPGTEGVSPYWYLDRGDELSSEPVTVRGLGTTALKDQTLAPGDDTTAPGPVTGVEGSTENSGVHLSWTNPGEADFAGVTVRRAVGTTAPASPTTGQAVAEVTNPGTSLDDVGLVAGTTYSYALFAHDADGNYAPSATLTTTVIATSAASRQCGTIGASTTWSPANAPAYVLDCSVTVAPDVTLTIEPGTVVKGAGGAHLIVSGSLVSTGSAARRVTFTSMRDDAVAGDTNKDGTVTRPGRGDWPGITTSAVGGEAAPSVLMRHTDVLHAAGGLSAANAAVTVTESTFRKITGNGVTVANPVGVPRVSANVVTEAGGSAISVAGASIDLEALDGNDGSANGLNGVELSNDTVTVSSSLPWSGTLIPVLISGCNALTIAPGVTVTLDAGTIVKSQAANCAYFQVQGALVAHGTSEAPVTLTSWRDDTVGGDTNGDGGATGPQRGDWGGITAAATSSGHSAPIIDLDHARVRYASSPVIADQASVSITNSTIDKAVGDGVRVTAPSGLPRVSDNVVTDTGGSAIVVQNAAVDMDRLDGNYGSGNGLNGVRLSAVTVTVSSSLPWDGTLVPVLEGGCNALTIAPEVTLTLGAGAIVKAQSSNCAYINVQGRLLGTGTATSPATLTSWRDDSVGGDTNGDGTATSPVRGDWGGIVAGAAGNGRPDPVLDLDRVRVRYATGAVSASQTAVSVTNSTIDRATGDGISISSPNGVPRVVGNTISDVAGTAIVIQSASIDVDRLDGNSGSGNGINGVRLVSTTVTESSSLPWTGSLLPVLDGGCGSMRVAPGVTLTLDAGTVIKARATNCAYLQVEGALVANGTSERPVTLTSWRDDTVGGDTNGDGTATGPARGDWGGVYASPAGNGNEGPSLRLDRVRIRYAGVGLSASGSTVSITNSVVDRMTSDGIAIASPVGIPRVTGSTVTNVGGSAIVVQSASVDMDELDGNSGSGNGLNGVQLSQDTVTVSSSLPWTGTLAPVLYGGCSALTVAPNVTLTLGAGTIVKAQSNNCAYLAVHGALVADGTAANPVTLTSWRDDTVGGDTNGDGTATTPARGDWGGVYSTAAGNGLPEPTVDLERVRVRYAGTGLSLAVSTVTVTDSTIDRTTADGIAVLSPVGIPRVTGNTVTNAGGVAIGVQSATIDMARLNGNSGSNNGLNGVQLTATTLGVSSSLPWTGSLVPVLSGGCSALTVAPNVTLTMEAGTVVKAQSSNCAYLHVQGSLIANGTSASPVTLTSWRDDTVAGDTNGDGNTTGPEAGNWGGIQAAPAGSGNPDPVLDLDRADVRYTNSAIVTSSTRTTVTNSTISAAAGDGIAVSSPNGIPRITGNTVNSAAATAIWLQSSSVDLDELDGNSGLGNGLNGVRLYSVTITGDSSLPWSGNFEPVLGSGCSSMTIAPRVKLTLNAGTVIKGESCTRIAVQGALIGNGTSGSPAILTSLKDDTVGGDTNGDGAASSPAEGDWAGVESTPAGNGNPNPTITLNQTSIRYATLALSLTTAADVTGNGSHFDHNTQAIDVSAGSASFSNASIAGGQRGIFVVNGRSATFQGRIVDVAVGASTSGGATLEARDTDWGDTKGPAPWGDGTLIQGQGISVYPWAGAPPPPAKPTAPVAPLPAACADVFMIGVDGSSQIPPYPGNPNATRFVESKEMQDLYASMSTHLDPDRDVRMLELPYPADGVVELAAGWPGWARYHYSYLLGVYGGVDWNGHVYPGLVRTVKAEMERCPDELLVLAGYSQGAWVLHDALIELGEQGRDVFRANRIGGIVLLADPKRMPDNALSIGSADPSAKGILWHIGGMLGTDANETPDWLTGLTKSICNDNDPVCAPSTLQVETAEGAYEAFSGLLYRSRLTIAMGLVGAFDVFAGFRVHGSKLPDRLEEKYACDPEQGACGDPTCAPGASEECGSLMWQQGRSIANRVKLFAKPKQTHFVFDWVAGQPGTSQLEAHMREDQSATWRLKSGSPPDGATLANDGTISGTVAASGTYSFDVEVEGGFNSWRAAKVTLRVGAP